MTLTTPSCYGDFPFRNPSIRAENDCNKCVHLTDCLEYTYDLNELIKVSENMAQPLTPLDKQVDGNHYKDLKIQPVEYIHANNIGYMEGNVIKYVSRWRAKNGIKDLEKAKHYIDLLIELESKRGNDA